MNHITIFLESLPITALVASCHLRKRLGRSFLRLTDSQDLLEERLRNPSSSLEERIESAKRRAHQVRVKIQQDLVCFSSFTLTKILNIKLKK